MMEANNTVAVNMTEAQKAQFEAFLAAKKQEEEKAAAKQMRTDYRDMVDQTIEQVMPKLMSVSEELANQKRKVFEEFSTILELKAELFKMEKGEELDNQSHTFTNSKGNMRIVLGNYVTDGYLDTAEEGIRKVESFIQSLASDENSKALVGMVMKLLSKDAKGTLKASRIIQLRKMAEDSGNAEFIEGVAIIEEAYHPQVSRTFLKAYIKDLETGAWVHVPLGMTEAK